MNKHGSCWFTVRTPSRAVFTQLAPCALLAKTSRVSVMLFAFLFVSVHQNVLFAIHRLWFCVFWWHRMGSVRRPSFFITEMLLTNQVVLGNEKPECYHSPYYEGFIKSLTKHWKSLMRRNSLNCCANWQITSNLQACILGRGCLTHVFIICRW